MMFNRPHDAIRFLSTSEFLSYEDSFALSTYVSKLLRSEIEEVSGRDLVIRIRDAWQKIPESTKSMWNDLTEAAGLYPYVNPEYLSKSGLLRYEYHKSPHLEDVYFHEEQQLLSIELKNKKAVVVSAPTSFGKSLLIEEIIASKEHTNIVIIQPTLALLDETRKKLLKYRQYYKLILSTDQEPEREKGNIFLFTGERVLEYVKLPKIDFFVIDEFYKLSLDRNDDRAITLNQAFHKLLQHTKRFYLLGPIIQNIPMSFKEQFNLTWFPTNFATVAVDEKSIEISRKIKTKERKLEKKRLLFEYLNINTDQTLIYCSSPNKATQLAIEYAETLKYVGASQNSFDNASMIDWITENINRNWSLIHALEVGVAFHHGALPRHLGSSIVDAFNEGNIRYLFCTSTLIEGVNTTAKTVILFDKEKGTLPLDFFDYKNIAGRSGRMKKHFVGNVIRLEKQPEQMDLFVDIPLFNQQNAPLEILIELKESEIDDAVKEKLSTFNQLSEDLKSIIRKNNGVNIEGQLNIIRAIQSDITRNIDLMNWTSYPRYEQLLAVIKLGWTYLLKPGENKADIRSPEQLAFLTIKYASIQSVTALITDTINDQFWINRYPDIQDRTNKATFFILNVTRHWFDYKLPKWISVISTLQEHVFGLINRTAGNYSFFAGSLENGFLPKGFAALMEYDIPYSAIKKIQMILAETNTAEQNIMYINQLSYQQLKKIGLMDYEIKKINNSL